MIKKMITVLLIALANVTIAQKSSPPAISESPIVLHTKTGDIFGSLVLPATTGNVPVALIIAGSGPTDRDCNSPVMKNDAYKKLAQALALNNIASVRYDKR